MERASCKQWMNLSGQELSDSIELLNRNLTQPELDAALLDLLEINFSTIVSRLVEPEGIQQCFDSMQILNQVLLLPLLLFIITNSYLLL